jgi:hypothetical protein
MIEILENKVDLLVPQTSIRLSPVTHGMPGMPIRNSSRRIELQMQEGRTIQANTPSMARFRGGAALLAVAILLLPGLCRVHSPLVAPVSEVQHADLPCHEPSPASQEAPDSQQKCCRATHQPEALLSSAHLTPALAAADCRPNPLLNSSYRSSHASPLFAVFSGPPGPLSLRI